MTLSKVWKTGEKKMTIFPGSVAWFPCHINRCSRVLKINCRERLSSVIDAIKMGSQWNCSWLKSLALVNMGSISISSWMNSFHLGKEKLSCFASAPISNNRILQWTGVNLLTVTRIRKELENYNNDHELVALRKDHSPRTDRICTPEFVQAIQRTIDEVS